MWSDRVPQSSKLLYSKVKSQSSPRRIPGFEQRPDASGLCVRRDGTSSPIEPFSLLYFWEVGEIDCISSSHEAPKNRSSIDGCRDGCAGRWEVNLPCSRSRDSAAGIPSPTGAIGATPVSVKGSTAVVRSERKHCGIIIDGFNGGRALRTTKLPHRNNEFRDPERSRDAP